jgi:hypothetical protein
MGYEFGILLHIWLQEVKAKHKSEINKEKEDDWIGVVYHSSD